MIKDLIKKLTPVLVDEISDYDDVLNFISQKAVASFFPLIWTDLWPIYALECTNASAYKPTNSIYIAPIGAHNFYAAPILKRLIENFYLKDEINDNPLYYGTTLEEMILLQGDMIDHEITIDTIGTVNAVYMNLSMKNDKSIHLFLIVDTPDNVWKMIEGYNIKTDYIIDSHKGLNDYFTRIPLYDTMKNTPKAELLPKYYFKGKFSKDTAPDGFERIYVIPTHEHGEAKSEIYLTNWNK